MVESDHSDCEQTQAVSESNEPKDNVSAKRPREESSDVETEPPSKKVHIEEVKNDENTPSNGTKEEDNKSIEAEAENKTIETEAENKTIETEAENKTIEIEEEKTVENNVQDEHTTSDDANTTEDSKKLDSDLKDKADSEKEEIDKNEKSEVTDIKNVTENGIANRKSEEKNIEHEEVDTKNENLTNNDNNEISDKNEKIFKDKKDKTKKEDSEIINGVELTVECASDKESSEQSEEEKYEKPRVKTIIVREKPNDSEVDASSSDTEKSNTSNLSEVKSSVKVNDSPAVIEKKTVKTNRARVSSKPLSTSENSVDSSSDDEDYSPVKKKVKKSSSPKKNADKSTGAKRGRGRPRGRPPKYPKTVGTRFVDDTNKDKKEHTEKKSDEHIKKEISEKQKELNNKSESKNEESTSDSSNDKSDNESNNDSGSKKMEKKQREAGQRNSIKIKNLKKYIRTAGIRVHCYQTLLKDCKTDAAKVRFLGNFLEEHGIVGRPTLEKCEKLKRKNETQKEIEELDTNNIVSETRATRGTRKIRKSQAEPEVHASPGQKSRKSRIQTIVDSDSE